MLRRLTQCLSVRAFSDMAKNRKFIIAKKIEGEPKPTDFKLIEEPVPKINDKDIHCEAVALSVDPYMRPLLNYRQPEGLMFGEQVAKVVESKHPDFKVGDLVVGYFGWQTNFVGNPDEVESPFGGISKPYVLPDLQGLSPSLGLGVLGMPGNTAYFGLTELCDPKPGKTLVVSGAAGAVGSLVGQIGKALGLKVIGFAGSDDKVDFLQRELKFDHAFNYKKTTVKEALTATAPDGVDCYFDNVGGHMSSDILKAMNNFGRIALCGAISTYNMAEPPLVPAPQLTMILKQVRMEGFIVGRWQDRWLEGINQNLQWIKEGKLVVKEHITKGFENMPHAFIGLLRGENTGKAVVHV